MTTPRRKSATQAFLRSVDELLAALPTAEERHEFIRGIDELSRFLADLRGGLERLPASDDQVRQSLRDVRVSMERIEANELASSALGLRRSAARKSSTPMLDIRGSDALLSELRQLNEDALRVRLEQMPASLVRGVARVLGLPTARVARESLATQVASKIVNAKGYEILRSEGGPNASA